MHLTIFGVGFRFIFRQMFRVSILLPSGYCETLSLPELSTVGDLKLLAQKALGRVLKLVTMDMSWPIRLVSLQAAGQDKEHLTAVVQPAQPRRQPGYLGPSAPQFNISWGACTRFRPQIVHLLRSRRMDQWLHDPSRLQTMAVTAPQFKIRFTCGPKRGAGLWGNSVLAWPSTRLLIIKFKWAGNMSHHVGVSEHIAFSKMIISIGKMMMIQFSHGIVQPIFSIFQQTHAQASRIIVSFPMVAVWPVLRIETWVPADWLTYPLGRSTDKRSPAVLGIGCAHLHLLLLQHAALLITGCKR